MHNDKHLTRRDFGRGIAAILAASAAPSVLGGGMMRNLGGRLAALSGGGGGGPWWQDYACDYQWDAIDHGTGTGWTDVRNGETFEGAWQFGDNVVNNTSNFYVQTSIFNGLQEWTYEVTIGDLSISQIGRDVLNAQNNLNSIVQISPVSTSYPNWQLRYVKDASSTADAYASKSAGHTHFAVKYENGYYVFFVNGAKVGSYQGYNPLGFSYIIFHKNYRRAVRITKTALTDQQVKANYDLDVARYHIA